MKNYTCKPGEHRWSSWYRHWPDWQRHCTRWGCDTKQREPRPLPVGQ